MSNKEKVTIYIKQGSEVHGPKGTISLPLPCRVGATLEKNGTQWQYTINGDSWWVASSCALIMG